MDRLAKLAKITRSLGAALAIALLFTAPRPAAQEQPKPPNEETVASLSAGRVVVAVVKGAILIGTIENPIEPDTHPPTPVAIGSVRVGVILGAVRWSSPSSQREIARLDEDLPHLRSRAVTQAQHLATDPAGTEATDLESVGQGLLDRLNEVAQDLHSKVDLPAKEPLAELVLAGYATDYGPEVWQLAYAMKQQEETPGYWTTRVLLPSYVQFWPPEKGQPHTLGPENGGGRAAVPAGRKQQNPRRRRDAVPTRRSRRDRPARHARDHGHHQRGNRIRVDSRAAPRNSFARHTTGAPARRALAPAPHAIIAAFYPPRDSSPRASVS